MRRRVFDVPSIIRWPGSISKEAKKKSGYSLACVPICLIFGGGVDTT